MGQRGSCPAEPAKAPGPVRLILHGLPGAGAGTVLRQLGEVSEPAGIREVDCALAGTPARVLSWELGGSAQSYRDLHPLWCANYRGAEGLLVVVDSRDFRPVNPWLDALFTPHGRYAEHLRPVPLLVLANFQDVPEACVPGHAGDVRGHAGDADDADL